MRVASKFVGVFALSGILGLTIGAQPPNEPADRRPVDVPDETVRPAISDCGLSGTVDPNGNEARKRTASATSLFAKSHASLLGEGVPPGSDRGQVGVVTRTPRVNFIDDEIFGTMERAGVTPASLSSDAEFLRRVTLDLTGRIPDAATVKTFLADKSADKRTKMIEALLASDAFNDRWAFFYDELFRNTFNADSGKLGFSGRNSLHAYFVDAVHSGKPWNVMARELITAAGNSADGGGTQKVDAPANFPVRNIQTNGPAQDTYDNLAASTGSVFLGVNIFCTSCHSGAGHTDSINVWLTQKGRADFWGMAAFYSRIQMRRQGTTPATYYYAVSDRTTGEYALGTTTGNKTPRDGKYWANGATTITPKFIISDEVPQKNEDYRTALARMVTTSPQFARAHVNYIWKEMFALGIVEPVDGFDLARQDPSNPPPSPWTIQPTHPQLLTRLADYYAGSGYDLRQLLRLITQSRSYQLSSSYPGEWKESYTSLFARHFVRRLRAEEIYDAISRATAVQPSLTVNGYTSPVLWAGQLPDVDSEPTSRPVRLFLDAFLRGDRDTNKRSAEGTILQALSLMNDRNVTDRIKSATKGTATNTLVTAKATPQETVNALYLQTLSRLPSTDELAAGVALFSNLKQGQTAATVTEDLQFALLNKLDFIFNY